MSENKQPVPHTPGPWGVSHSGFANAPFVIFAGTKAPDYRNAFPLSGVNAIAEVFHDESPAHDEQFANACLLAAAPDLLRELEKAVEYLREYGAGAACDTAVIAINNAKGVLA